MTEFIPPYPKRHESWPGPLEMIKYARQDLLSIWPQKAFQVQFPGMSIFTQGFFIANCPDAVAHVLANYGTKNPLMHKVLAPLLGNDFDSDKETWYKAIQSQTDFLNAEFAAQHSDTVNETIAQFASQWLALKSGEKIALLPQMNHLTIEIIGKVLFGKWLNNAQIVQIKDVFFEYRTAVEKMDISLFLGLPSWIPKFGGNPTTKAVKNLQKVIDDLIVEGKKNAEPESALSVLLRLRDAEHPNGLTPLQLRNELIMLLMAGYETMANTLTWAWFLLSQTPEAEQKLHLELDSVLSARVANFADLSQLPFTRAIVDETLRLYPPFPLLSREAKTEDKIRDRAIPIGSTLLIVPWLLQRHERFWDKPDHFIPERFLPTAATKPDMFVYQPFSASPHAAAARFFATFVAPVCLATLAKQFQLALPAQQEVSHECRLLLRPKGDMPMLIAPR